MSDDLETGDALIAAWRTNNRVTTFLVEHLPRESWSLAVPGFPRKTIRSIATHMHNARCAWTKMLGTRHGIAVPKRADPKTVRQTELVRALNRSSAGIIDLIRLGIARGERFPARFGRTFPPI